ncbi:MAG: PAS domain S-box protein [Desulfobacterales bacterium]|nr:PAS domain S-box protein [Desulfobacterales bacterium]MCF8080477.1 PAS domain S-box protein [Desulfobacterales bacterium]
MTVSFFPIWFVDVIGSILMIVLSILCLRLTLQLRRKDESNLIWAYLFWICLALTGFAVSRSGGHIVKQFLLAGGHSEAWFTIRPYSGAINTVMFMVVASITLFFERTWKIYQDILRDRQALQSTHAELIYLNQNLESLVQERTRELAASERKHRRIFEVSRDMILVATPDGVILDINPAGQAMLGYPDQGTALLGRPLGEFIAAPAQLGSIQETLSVKGFVANREMELKHKDGRRTRCLVSASLDTRSTNARETVHLLIRDIEQRRQIEEQIAQADKLASIGELSAGIAHEINNPLGVILGYTQLLIRHEDPASENYQDLKTIEKHVRNCKSIVEDLLHFARTSPPQEDKIRIDEAIDDVLDFVRQHADVDRIEIQRDYDPSVPQMRLDEKKMKQVFMNLVMNALHAVGERGRITIETEYAPDREQVDVRISDTGYGIEEKHLAKIFDPFFTTKPTGEGTGLGLSVSYGIVKNHGGDIAVESQKGAGTTFTITLPVLFRETTTDDRYEQIDSDRR